MEEVEIIKMIPHVVKSLQRRIWIDYDEDTDVLYMNFTYPSKGSGTRRRRERNPKKLRRERKSSGFNDNSGNEIFKKMTRIILGME